MSWRGAPVYRATATGCLADRVVVHESVALPLRGAVPLGEAALLGCAALTGIGAALFAARVRPGDTCLVIGAGGVGAFVAQGARIAGAGAVVVVDPVAERRALALAVGATHCAAPEDAEELLRSVAPEGADVAFDAVGTAETATAALDLTCAGGTTMLVGLPPAGTRLDLDPAHFLRREKWLTGTMYGSEDPAVALPVLLDHLRAGRLSLAPLVGPTFPLEAADEAVRAALAGTAGRVLVVPGGAA
jgi:S-(hydroxymethyl)glutathione dehydrogenase/alcohol dehydrogenase